MHAAGRIVSGHRRLALFQKYLDWRRLRPGAGWLASWNSTKVPRISSEALRADALPKTKGGRRKQRGNHR